jgi:hypothetical protein
VSHAASAQDCDKGVERELEIDPLRREGDHRPRGAADHTLQDSSPQETAGGAGGGAGAGEGEGGGGGAGGRGGGSTGEQWLIDAVWVRGRARFNVTCGGDLTLFAARLMLLAPHTSSLFVEQFVSHGNGEASSSSSLQELAKTLAGAPLWQLLSGEVRKKGELIIAPSSMRSPPDALDPRTRPAFTLESKWGSEGMVPKFAYCQAPILVAVDSTAGRARQGGGGGKVSETRGGAGHGTTPPPQGNVDYDSVEFVGVVTCQGIAAMQKSSSSMLHVQCALEWRQGGIKIQVSERGDAGGGEEGGGPVPDILKLVAPVLSLPANTSTLLLHLPPPHTLSRGTTQTSGLVHKAARRVEVSCRSLTTFFPLCLLPPFF